MNMNCRKLIKLENKDIGEGRFNELPDSILLHILSLLLTEYVGATSILSKRWRNLWTSLPTLNFGEWSDIPNSRRQEIVEKMLLLHDSSHIQKFDLLCDGNWNACRIGDWITNLVRQNVEELAITSGETRLSLEIPKCVFSCESLRVLKVNMISNTLSIPDSVCLPNLKILYFGGLRFPGDYLMEQLFSNCPVLKELYIDYCFFVKMNIVNISAPVLERLSIMGGVDYRDLKIYAPNLKYFEYTYELPRSCDFGHFPLLVEAHIMIRTEIEDELKEIHEGLRVCAAKMLQSLSSVKDLEATGEAIHFIFHDENLSVHLPTFKNLIHMEVNGNIHRMKNRALLNLLKISPNLESLVVNQEESPEDLSLMHKVPECLLKLKMVKIFIRSAYLNDLETVQYFLKNAPVLETMVIALVEELEEDKKTVFMDQLYKFPRASTKSFFFKTEQHYNYIMYE